MTLRRSLMARDEKDRVKEEGEHLRAEATQYGRDHLVDFKTASDEPDVARVKGRLVAGNTFLLNMRPNEQPHVQVRNVKPFEVLFRAVPDGASPETDDEDFTPRIVTATSPMGNRLSIYSIAALVMADADGFTAGELVWLSRAVSTVLDRTDHVLVARGDDSPLLPVTSKILSLI
jgi:hypothetical protein